MIEVSITPFPVGGISKLLLLLQRFLVCLAPVLIEDIDNAQRDAVVVLQANAVVKALAGVSVEHPGSEWAQRILVA